MGEGKGEVALETESASSSLGVTSGVFFWTLPLAHIKQQDWRLTATQAADVRMIDTPTKLKKEGNVWNINNSRMIAKKTEV